MQQRVTFIYDESGTGRMDEALGSDSLSDIWFTSIGSSPPEGHKFIASRLARN